MENTLVSARIPRAKKEAAAGILRKIGANASDLINSAYDYLLENGELPHAEKTERVRSGFDEFLAASTLNVDWGSADAQTGDYKQMIRDWRREDYESLA